MDKKTYMTPAMDIIAEETMQLLAVSDPVLGGDYDGSTEVLAPKLYFDVEE